VFELVRHTARDAAKNGFDGRTGFGVVSLPRALAAAVPIVDPGEPNDDVDLIRSPQILGAPTPPLTDASDTSATLTARLDAVEDPHDVYEVFVPAKRRVEITVKPTGKADVALWNATTESVTGLRRNRLALSAKAGSARERIVWRNTGASGVVAFVDVRLPGGRGGQSSRYVLRVRVR
jgi:hypothetical protein